MLKEILNPEDCARCKFCCSFRRQSLWEVPDKIKEYDWESEYKTDDPYEEVPCPYLVDGEGCQLDASEKPFECKIWPYRIMKMPTCLSNDSESKLVLAYSKSCPAFQKLDKEVIVNFGKKIMDTVTAEAVIDPSIIKEFDEGYEVI